MTKAGRAYWRRWTDGEGTWTTYEKRKAQPPPGEDLAALRRGAGREPGTVPSMWPFYTVGFGEDRLRPGADSWDLPSDLVAEHHALVLFGFHQQSELSPVHRKGIGVGQAVRALHRGDERFSKDAVDRRFYAAVVASTPNELARRLRGLVQQLKVLNPTQGLDYDDLLKDLTRWSRPEGRDRVRRRWGLDYERADDRNQGDDVKSRAS